MNIIWKNLNLKNLLEMLFWQYWSSTKVAKTKSKIK